MQLSRTAGNAAPTGGHRTRRLAGLVSVALFGLLTLAPGAYAWHGYLKVKKVVVDSNASRKASASFLFKVERQDAPPSGSWAVQVASFPLSDGQAWMTPAGGWASGGDTSTTPWKNWRVTEYGAGTGTSLSDYETSMSCSRPYKGDTTYEDTSSLWSDLFVAWGAWPSPTYNTANRSAVTQLRWANNLSYVSKCVFTNKRKPRVKVVKDFDDPVNPGATVTVNLNGTVLSNTDAAPSQDFGDGDSSAFQNVDVGSTPTIGESSAHLGDYTKTIACTVNGAEVYSTATDAAGASWTLPASATAAGNDITCTIKNERKRGTIKLVKHLVPSADHGFDLLLDGGVVASDVGENGQSEVIPVTIGQHAVAEQAHDTQADTLDNYLTELACAKPAGEATQDVPVVGGKVDVGIGDDVVCTFTNTKKGRITVKKVTIPAGSPTEFPFASESFDSFSLKDQGTQSFTVAPGSYAISEVQKNAWTLQSIECTDAAQAAEQASQGDVAGRTATFNVQPGEDVTCTFTNKQDELPGKVTPSSQPGSGVSPVTPSGGVTRPKASSRLSGTVGCAARYSTASVRGKEIKRVTFYLDGKKVKTVSVSSSGVARYRVATRSLRHGTHKLTAKVEFTAASGAAPRTYRLSFSRCTSRRVSPRFTG